MYVISRRERPKSWQPLCQKSGSYLVYIPWLNSSARKKTRAISAWKSRGRWYAKQFTWRTYMCSPGRPSATRFVAGTSPSRVDDDDDAIEAGQPRKKIRPGKAASLWCDACARVRRAMRLVHRRGIFEGDMHHRRADSQMPLAAVCARRPHPSWALVCTCWLVRRRPCRFCAGQPAAKGKQPSGGVGCCFLFDSHGVPSFAALLLYFSKPRQKPRTLAQQCA